MTSTNDIHGNTNEAFQGDRDLERESEARLQASNNELAETLRSLDQTMRQHMLALDRRKEIVNSSPKLQPIAAKPPPALAIPPPAAGGQRPSITAVADLPRSEKSTVFTRIVFLKLGEIDTLRDRFNAEVFITSRWREQNLDGKRQMKSSDIDWTQYWSPKLIIENGIGEMKETITKSVSFDSSGRAMIYEKRRANGTFQEFMELYQFPFDTQDLTVTVTSERTEKEVEILEDPNEKSALNIQSFTGEQEWQLHPFMNTWRKIRIDENKSPKTKHSAFSAAGKASRRAGFFIWNILVVMFLICSLSFATFSVDINLPQNRLQLAFILLLTTVSFKFVVNQSLPMISYLTYMDKYILSSMAILCCICVWHAVIPVINGTPPSGKCCTDFAIWVDKIALFILASLYVGFHVAFVLIILFVANESSKAADQSNSAKVGVERNNDYDDC